MNMELILYPIKISITGMPYLGPRILLGVLFTTIVFILDRKFGAGRYRK